jgi:type I restriction enzyme S subunit
MKSGWTRKNLGDLCQVIGGGTPSKDKAKYYSGDIPWATVRDMRSEVITETECKITREAVKCSATNIIPSGNVVIATRVGLGKVCLLGQDTAINQDLRGIVPIDLKVLSVRFLFWWLKSIADSIVAEGTGATVQGVKLPFVKSLQAPVPPLNEQQRIVGILDEAFEGIAIAAANAEKNLHNARALFESHLQSVFTQRGKGWVETTLEKVLAVQPQNGWSPPAANHSASGTPVLTLSSVTGFRFRPDKRKFTSASTDSRRNYWIKNGDFLITRSNTPELVGHVAIAAGITEPTIYPDLIMRMNPAPDRMMTEFLYFQMRSPALRKEIMGRAQGANPTMKKISNGAVKTLPIAVPPIATQRAIVETMYALTEETQRLESIYQQKLAALDELKKSLLHRAFNGELIRDNGQ